MRVLRANLFPYIVAYIPLIFPLYLFKGEFAGIPLTLPEILIYLCFAVFIFKEGLYRISWKILPLALFIFTAILSALIVPDVLPYIDGSEYPARLKALGILKGWIFVPILYFTMARFYFREKAGLVTVAMQALLLSGLFLSSNAVYQALTETATTIDGRISGPFESANYLSLYLGPLAIYAVFSFLEKKERSEKIFYFVTGFFILIALFLTQSYAAWLAFFATIFLGLFLWLKNEYPKKFKWFLIGSFVLGFVLILSQLGSDKFQQFFELQNRSSSSVRLEVYDISLALIKSSPFFGIGLGTFEPLYQVNAPEILGRAPFEWVMLHPHNIFLAMWLNMGLFGLISFLWLSYKALGWLSEKYTKEKTIIALMLISILVHGLFDTPYFKNDLALEFWLIMAVLL